MGAGFAGIYFALKLRKAGKIKKHYQIVIVNDKDYFLFTPLLVNLFTEKITPGLIKEDLKKIFPDFKIVKEDIGEINFSKNKIYGIEKSFNYDYLIIASGAKTNYFGIEGAQKFTQKFKTLSDFEKINKETERLNLGIFAGSLFS